MDLDDRLDDRLDRVRREVREQRLRLQDCVRRSLSVRESADAHRRQALARTAAALARGPRRGDRPT